MTRARSAAPVVGRSVTHSTETQDYGGGGGGPILVRDSPNSLRPASGAQIVEDPNGAGRPSIRADGALMVPPVVIYELE